jgi:hypothetical protein
MRALFGLIHNHDKLASGSCHDFLPEQRSATTFDEIQLRVNLVGTVDSHIDFPGLIVA